MTDQDETRSDPDILPYYTVTSAYQAGPLLILQTVEGMDLRVDPEGLFRFFLSREPRKPSLLGRLCGIVSALIHDGASIYVTRDGSMVDGEGAPLEPEADGDLRRVLQNSSKRDTVKKESETCLCGETSLKRTAVLRHPRTQQVYGCPHCMPEGESSLQEEEDFDVALARFKHTTKVCHVELDRLSDTDDAIRCLRYFIGTDTGLDYTKREVVYDQFEKLQFVWSGQLWHKCIASDADIVGQKFKTIFYSLREDVFTMQFDDAKKLSKIEERAWKEWSEHISRRLDEGPLRKVVRTIHTTKGYYSPASDFDANKTDLLLNVKNGTIDLRTGELRPHDKADRITKMVDIEFHADAKCPRFDRVLYDVTGGDPAFMAYFARLFGYALTGSTKENKFFIFFQPAGGGGKGTILELMHYLLGGASQYSANLEVKSLTVDGEKDIRDDLARCQGKRFILAQEPNKSDVLAESLIKKLSSGDRISAALKFQNEAEFRWTAKLFIPSNVRPYVEARDEAFWDRPQVIPFTKKFRGTADEDQDILGKLKAEAPGILAWAVRGCLGWQGLGEFATKDEAGVSRSGLRPPKQVVEATRDYREAQVGIGAWLAQNLRTVPGHFLATEDVYDAYQFATLSGGDNALGDREFAMRLARQIQSVVPTAERDKAYDTNDRKQKRGWRNVCLASKMPSAPETDGPLEYTPWKEDEA